VKSLASILGGKVEETKLRGSRALELRTSSQWPDPKGRTGSIEHDSSLYFFPRVEFASRRFDGLTLAHSLLSPPPLSLSIALSLLLNGPFLYPEETLLMRGEALDFLPSILIESSLRVASHLRRDGKS